MTSGKIFSPLACSCDHHLLERAALAGMLGQRLVARQALAVLGDLAGARLALDRRAKRSPASRRALQAEHLDRRRRAGFLHAARPDR